MMLLFLKQRQNLVIKATGCDMVIVNGCIQINEKANGGLDENGNPVRQPETLSEPIPCRISVAKRDNLGKINGNAFTDASYTILLEQSHPFEAEQVRLTQYGHDLGMFSVKRAEYLEGVGAIQIIV